MCFIRERQRKSQKEFSIMININLDTYKSIESAEQNISFDTLDIIYHQFKNEEALHEVF
jgi:transcriptional regulator with XRE-family HTH domain